MSNYLGSENPGTKLNCLPSAWVYWPDVTRWTGFPLVTSPCGTVVGGEHSQWNSDFLYGLRKYNPSKNKKNKDPRILFRKWTQNFWKLLSIHYTWINKINRYHQTLHSWFKKTIETHCKPINIQKAMNNTIIIQTTNQIQSKKILKWKQFGKLNIKTYTHPTLNFSKGVIKSLDLALWFPWRNKITS